MIYSDVAQKTWIPEGTREYAAFKQITGENRYLATFLRDTFPLAPHDLVLDVGGRQADIAYAIQNPASVHLVDPDPSISPVPEPGRFWRCRIQDADIPESSYQLIICSHVLGYLAKKNEQREVLAKLLPILAVGGTLVLFYNRNTDYIGELLRYSAEHLEDRHYDYFDERIIEELPPWRYKVSWKNAWFNAKYPNFVGLSRACWFLFGATNQDISAVAGKFQSKLERDNSAPELNIEQRIVCVSRREVG